MTNLIYNVLTQPPRPIIFIKPDATITECVDKMTHLNIGALVVCDKEVCDKDKLIGIISERDILRSCCHKKLDFEKTTAKKIAYKKISVLDINDPVEKAMETMTTTKRRHVLVSENNKIVALLSIGDLLYFLLEDKSRVIEHLERYIRTS